MTAATQTERITPDDRPWQGWHEEVLPCRLHDLEVRVRDGSSRRAGALALYDRTEQRCLGCLCDEGVHALGAAVGFPSSFVLSLRPALAAEVSNDRIHAHRDREIGIVTEDGLITALLPDGREPLTSAETAQAVVEAVQSHVDHAVVERAERFHNRMRLQLTTPIERPITAQVGDILRAGVQVIYEFGQRTAIDLIVERLVCTNGMTLQCALFQWRQATEEGREAQRLWLRRGVAETLDAFDDLTQRARQMAATEVDGDPEEALLHRAAALGVPRRHHDRLRAAFREEPGNTEWSLLNAITRVATHAPLPYSLGRRLQAAAGAWAAHFDLVTARLPRPVAVQVGAQIIEPMNP